MPDYFFRIPEGLTGGIWEIFLRLALAFLSGFIIGLERESHKQPAGMRTHALICGVSALLMIISMTMPFVSDKAGDPGRIAAQVVSGIGFLGAGAIIKMGTHVKGLTTAASIWGAAGIGLALGAGLYGPGILTLVIMLFFLHILFPLGKKIFPPKWRARLELEYKGKFPKKEVIDKVFESFKLKNQCKETKVNRSKENISEIKVYELDGKGIFDTEELFKAFRQKGDLQCFRLTDTGND